MTETPQLITGPDPSAQFWAAHREHRLIALHASGTTGMAHTIVRTTSSWVDSFAPPGHPDPEMGEATDLLAAKKQISRTRQDTYATTQQNGSFTAEIVPINDQVTDQRPRTFTAERLTRFRPIFRPGGGSATTAGFCGINDGAVAVLMCDQGSYATRPKDRLPGLGQLRSGPPRLGHRPSHPIRPRPPLGSLQRGPGVRLFSQLVRQHRGRYGLAVIAIGGSQGAAMVVERVGG